MTRVLISDPTLRDGSHAVRHQLTEEQLATYLTLAESSGIPIVEVGHGNGLGASSLHLGESLVSDLRMIQISRAILKNSKLCIHVIPGFATVKKDLEVALDNGVDIVRVASHCTEADITRRHIEYTKAREKIAYGVLMMSHMTSIDNLVNEALKMQQYGADGVIIMDSAGAYLPVDVKERIRSLVDTLDISVGFHAHNNLGLAIGNSLSALESGADILDGTIRGFGAGAGNAQLEVLVAVLEKMGYQTGIDLNLLLEAAEIADKQIITKVPTINSTSIVSGLAGVFSGFVKPVERISEQYAIDPKEVFYELGRRKVVAGQEDIIYEVVSQLAGLRV